MANRIIRPDEFIQGDKPERIICRKQPYVDVATGAEITHVEPPDEFHEGPSGFIAHFKDVVVLRHPQMGELKAAGDTPFLAESVEDAFDKYDKVKKKFVADAAEGFRQQQAQTALQQSLGAAAAAAANGGIKGLRG